MNWIRAAVLLILWAIGGCAPTTRASGPTPPPSQDDRGGMH